MRSLSTLVLRATALATVTLAGGCSDVDTHAETDAPDSVSLQGEALSIDKKLSRLRPILNCVETKTGGEFVAHWGYENGTANTQVVPVGRFNFFRPGPRNRAQPTVFLPGRHDGVVQVEFHAKWRGVVWALGTHVVAASTVSKPCNLDNDGGNGGSGGASGDTPEGGLPQDGATGAEAGATAGQGGDFANTGGNGGAGCTGTICGDDCVDLNTSTQHCGACNRSCITTEEVSLVECIAGLCTSTCAPGYENLTRPEAPALDDGCETPLATSVDHCGAPNRACSTTNVASRQCANGLCAPTCEAGYWDVNRPTAPAADDGCEAECPASLGGPQLIRLPEGYCIDSTEVSRAQYQSWLNRGPRINNQDPTLCGWNTTFEPNWLCTGIMEGRCAGAGCGRAEECRYHLYVTTGEVIYECTQYPPFGENTGAIAAGTLRCTGADCDNHPQTCVDWCDADAYCKAMGKRLCGKIGGGANAFGDVANASASQWYNACSSGIGNAFPYGNEYDPSVCKDPFDPLPGATEQVGGMGMCQSSVSGYEGVLDLSGNVSEWENSCNAATGPSDLCRVRARSTSGSGARCDVEDAARRDNVDGIMGFRCCSP